MSGHSKWAGIKHKKAANDAKRGNVFTRMANNITVAAKQGGGKPEFNPSLRFAIDQARSANMPKDNIERAIKRGTGELGGAVVEELMFEAFGPANVMIMIDALTDNRNRTNSDVRMLLAKNGGRIADSGVAFQFEQKGVIRLTIEPSVKAKLEELIIDSGAEDYILDDDFAVIYTVSSELHSVKESIALGLGLVEGAEPVKHDKKAVISPVKMESAKIERVAKIPVELSDAEMEKVARLLDVLEDNDDITNVYTNIAE